MTTFFDAFQTALGSQTIKLEDIKNSLNTDKVKNRLNAALNDSIDFDGKGDGKTGDADFITGELIKQLDTFSTFGISEISTTNVLDFFNAFEKKDSSKSIDYTDMEDMENIQMETLVAPSPWAPPDDVNSNIEIAFVAAVTDLITKTVDFGLSPPATPNPAPPATSTTSSPAVPAPSSSPTPATTAVFDPNTATPQQAVQFLLDNKGDFPSVKDQWSAWKAKNPNEVLDFTGENFANVDFAGADLANSNLANAILTGANLTGVELEANGKFYNIMSSAEIQVSDDGSTGWEVSSDITNNRSAITAFEDIVNKAKDAAGGALINSTPLKEVITALEEANKEPAANPNTNPSTEPIQGINRDKFNNGLLRGSAEKVRQDVNMIQAALNERIQRGEITADLLVQDGVFGPKTAEAAQAWLNRDPNRRTLWLLVDGTTIPDEREGSLASKTKGLMLGVGSSGTEVEKLQTELNKPRAGLEINLTPDGIYGQATYEAVMAFQEWYNTQHTDPNSRLDVDGVAGPNTIAALKLAL